ncbi:MAG: efflux RND transporter periplasmic adaptor subunit [SAR86 cluster bacterium]|jgi:multidrug efflux system membrane fusion protein|nr:efflux RND transporter periplasmic adaptor subunit [SAR86 cluster bacterium]
MKVKQTYKTATISAIFFLIWMVSGSLVEEEASPQSESSLDTLSSVTVLNSNAILKSKTIKASGFTEADKFIQVRAEIGGRVISRPFKQGDYVKEGDLLCQLYIAGREAYPKIVAPFSGYLESLRVDKGDYLNTGGICASLIDSNPMLLIADIAEKEIADIDLGANSMARLISGDEIQGKVSFIATSADKNTRTFRVEVQVDNKDRAIRDGVSAEIYIESKKVLSHRISPAILSLNDQGKLGIRTVDNNNAVEFKEIEILEDTTEGLWVSGLNENERIITLGQEYVFQGQTVNVKEISSPEA